MKGFALIMKADNSEPSLGNELDNAFVNPLAMPPKNLPIAVPIVCRKLPPSLINQLKPGICAKAPTDAKTNASSAITTPMPKTPTIAPGMRLAIADKANINALNKPIPASPFARPVKSRPPNESIIP